jgi:glucose dehydrogenase
MVGRNLMDHVTQVSLCLSRDPIWPYRAPVETSGIEHLRDGDHRREWAAFRTPIGNDGWNFGGENPIALSADLIANEGLRGAALRERVKQTAERQVRLAALVEQLPNPDNRVTLSEDRVDALGNPHPRIQYQVDEYSLKGMEQARGLADQVFDAIGATFRQHQPTFFGAGHIIGTYRMGNDPATSVVNPQGRSHDHPNLYLAGAGLFPTEATANPTLTLCALALWCADTIKGELGR